MAMVKLITPGSQQLDDHVAELVKVASGGLRGADLAAFVKRAGHKFASLVKTIDLRPGEVPVHLIALGADEGFSGNRNGDGFEEYWCKRSHDTFVKYARPYRNHKNRPDSPAYGVVKASMYNEAMKRIELLVAYNGTKEAAKRNKGHVADKELERLDKKDLSVSMACKVHHDVCLTAGALIETAAGLKPIENVTDDDLLKTHLGAWKPIVQRLRRAYAGVVVELTVGGLPETATMTDNHPVLVAVQGQFRTCHGSAKGRQRRHTLRRSDTCTTCKKAVTEVRTWTAARDVRVGDYVVYPVTPPGTLATGLDQAYLLGVYAGNGSLICRRRGRKRQGPRHTSGVSISQGTAWPAVVDRIRTAATAVHGREQPVHVDKERNAVAIQIAHAGFATRCEQEVGTGARTKRLHERVFALDGEHRLAFLAGLLDSDGSVDLARRYGSGRISTVNRQLADQVQKLVWGLGYPATVTAQVVKGGFAPGTPCYHVCLCREFVARLAPYAVKAAGVTASDKPHTRMFVLDGYMHLPVQEVRHRYNECDVYNFAVADHETYVVTGYVVHNCSGCGNKARSRAEYCTAPEEGGSCERGGVKNNMTKVCEDGHVLHVLNPDPKFFDISYVPRPADRIAYAFGKLASGRVPGGAELAEELGVTAPPGVITADLADPKAAAAVCLIHELAAVEQAVEKAGAAPLQQAYALPPHGPADWSGHGASRTELPRVLAALAACKVAMPVEGFLELYADRPTALKAAAEVQRLLPGVYGRMAAEEPEQLSVAMFAPAPYEPGSHLIQWAGAKRADYGLERADVGPRLAAAALYGPPPAPRAPALVKAASEKTAAAESLARCYALYKVALLLAAYPSKEANIDAAALARELVVRQNYAPPVGA